MRLPIAVVLVVASLPWRTALADCDDNIAAIVAAVQDVSDPRLKLLVQFDLERARRESAEADEAECAQIINHAMRLLKTMH